MEPSAPDWNQWLRRSRARAWEWLALSVNIDPAHLGLSHFLALRQSGSRVRWTSSADPDWLLELVRRYRIMVNNRQKAGTPLFNLDSDLNIEDFLAWVIARKWKLPPQLRERARELSAPPEPAPTPPPPRTEPEAGSDSARTSEEPEPEPVMESTASKPPAAGKKKRGRSGSGKKAGKRSTAKKRQGTSS